MFGDRLLTCLRETCRTCEYLVGPLEQVNRLAVGFATIAIHVRARSHVVGQQSLEQTVDDLTPRVLAQVCYEDRFFATLVLAYQGKVIACEIS
jgi:hypothetical protein